MFQKAKKSNCIRNFVNLILRYKKQTDLHFTEFARFIYICKPKAISKIYMEEKLHTAFSSTDTYTLSDDTTVSIFKTETFSISIIHE